MNTVEPTAAATCPQCGHLNPRAARACDCGYDFVSQTKSLTFFPVATRKLIVLSICTFSIYELYWFYQNWKRIRAYAPHETFSPFWRAFFGVIWAIPLLQRMEEQAGAVGVAGTGSAVVLGVCYILLTISWRLPDPWWLVQQSLQRGEYRGGRPRWPGAHPERDRDVPAPRMTT